MSRDPSSPHQKEESDTQGGTVASTSAHPAAASNPKDGEAGKSTASVVEDGLTGTGTGSNEAADTSTSQQERQSQVLLEEEKDKTPEELRAELEKLRQELMSALQKKQGIDRQLVSHESAIYAFETSYLSVDLSAGPTNATFGNIVKGYDSYLKSGSAAADAARKKQSTSSTRGHGGLGPGYATGIVGPGGSILQPVMDEDRLFSRSSGTFLDSLQLRERDQNHLNALAGVGGGGSAGGTGNNTASDIEDLDDADLNDVNDDAASTTGGTTNANTPVTATSTGPPVSTTGATKDKEKDKDSAASRDAKRQKRK